MCPGLDAWGVMGSVDMESLDLATGTKDKGDLRSKGGRLPFIGTKGS